MTPTFKRCITPHLGREPCPFNWLEPITGLVLMLEPERDHF
jgi:hypothetical protein